MCPPPDLCGSISKEKDIPKHSDAKASDSISQVVVLEPDSRQEHHIGTKKEVDGVGHPTRWFYRTGIR